MQIAKSLKKSLEPSFPGPDLAGGGPWRSKGVALPHYPLPSKKSRKFFSGKHNVKFRHFPDKCRVKFGHFFNFSYVISAKNVLPPPNLTEL